MSGQTPGEPPALPEQKPKQPSQKSMTKAERRELQEKQKAAKAALKQQAGAPAGAAASPKAKQGAPRKGAESKLAQTPSNSLSSISGKESAQVAKDQESMPSRSGSRIFSHFAVPKRVGDNVKGDIHPLIVRLSLQFAELKICGANARCIATLNAFKSVRHSRMSSS
jgi:translation initiation factor eIF-2B subunit delta